MRGDVLLAAIIDAHGLKGDVRVKTFTARPGGLGAYGPLRCAEGRVFTVVTLRPGKGDEAVVRFAEIGDRDAAEKLAGVELFVARSALPQTAPEEFYHADLVGLEADDSLGRRLGRVTAVQNYGASDVLVVARDDGDELLIAFTRDNVPEIDMKAGRLVVAVPAEVEAKSARDPE